MSYFTLELDTTSPSIEIYAPRYSDNISNNQIRVVSNEKLSDGFQDIYILDSQGVRHDVVFSFDGDKEYVGNVIFDGFPYGVTTVYAQVKDEVGNISNLASAHMSLITSSYNALLRLSMSERTVVPIMSYAERKHVFQIKEKDIKVGDSSRKLTMKEKGRTTKVSDQN